MAPAGMISIGALAKRSGVQAETIRYYETEGLLPKPERSAGGYRLYGASDVDRLSFIRQARELGFKLDSVRRLLSLADREVDNCDEVRELASAHLAEIRAKLADLCRMERVLSDQIRSCEGRTVPECLLLAALAAPDVSRVATPMVRGARKRIGSRRSRSRRRGG
jgi:MerR family transcriptional regulator, mercuric resistance operon regulatory protein